MKKSGLVLLCLGVLPFVWLSCSPNQESGGDVDNKGEIAVTSPYLVVLGTDFNSYIFPDVQTLDEGTFDSAKESAKSYQISGDRRFHIYNERYLYAFAYSQDNPGKSVSFELDDHYFRIRREYDLSNGVQARTDFNQNVIGTYSDREYSPSMLKEGERPDTYVRFFEFDTQADQVDQTNKWYSYDFDGTKEIAYVTDLKQYNTYILAGIRTIKGYLPPNVFPEPVLLFDSDYEDRTYVGIFDQNYKLLKIVKDTEKTGMVGGLLKATGKTGIEVLDTGEVYVFCSAFSSTTRPSGVLKLDGTALEFDKEYFYNISEASGGHKLYRVHYMGGTLFCLQLFGEKGNDVKKYYDSPGAAYKFALFDVAQNSFQILDGEPGNIVSITDPYIDKQSKKIYFGINTTDQNPGVYVIDALKGTLKKGLSIKGQEIRYLGALKQ